MRQTKGSIPILSIFMDLFGGSLHLEGVFTSVCFILFMKPDSIILFVSFLVQIKKMLYGAALFLSILSAISTKKSASIDLRFKWSATMNSSEVNQDLIPTPLYSTVKHKRKIECGTAIFLMYSLKANQSLH